MALKPSIALPPGKSSLPHNSIPHPAKDIAESLVYYKAHSLDLRITTLVEPKGITRPRLEQFCRFRVVFTVRKEDEVPPEVVRLRVVDLEYPYTLTFL